MKPRSHTRRPKGPRDTPHKRRALLATLVVAVIALAICLGVSAVNDDPDAREADVQAPAKANVKPRTDRGLKADLIADLKRPPRLLILGGSRATRFEPSYFQQLTGLPGFNLAFQNGRPEDAWAFVSYVHRLYPKTKLRVVWFLHVEAFREQGLSPGLVDDKRLSRWFPTSLINAERKRQATLPAAKGRDLALTRYGADGVVLRNRYDLAVERGRTLKRALDWSVDTALERYATTSAALFPRSQRYFEKTLALLNHMGSTPAIVLMPLHPRLLAAVRTAGWDERHREVMGYLRGMQRDRRFVLLDCSRLSSFGGDPHEFYDGFHLKQANARKLIDAVVKRCPEAFD